MSDIELLQDCLSAFMAMKTAQESRKLLKKWSISHTAYAGRGQDLLSTYMAQKVHDHLMRSRSL